jgi:ATPase family associated with various cellular activities (AAA)
MWAMLLMIDLPRLSDPTHCFTWDRATVLPQTRSDLEMIAPCRALFTLAHRLAPAVIFVDEVDSMLSRRDKTGEHEVDAL